MIIKERFYGKDAIKVSVKNATQKMSLIRVRININGKRLTYYLPPEYKIRPKHFDIDAGVAIEDPKRNPDLKGNPQLKLILRNINTEIEKSINALILVLENFKLRGIQPSVETVREALRAELNRSVVNVKRAFADFPEFMSYYISLCKDGTILNGKGVQLVPGTIRNYISTQSAIKKYCANRKIKLKMDNVDIDFYNDFIKYLNEATHARGKYKPNVIGKFIKNIKVMLRYAYDNGYTSNEDFKRKEFKAYKENTETIYLNEDELKQLYQLELPDNQAQIRDSFLISCYTGLRYSDISRLEKKHLNFTDGMISIVTQKTNALVVIPMHQTVKEIFAKYGNQPPTVQCNQSTNRMLKKLCRMAGIVEPISIIETAGGQRKEVTYEKCDLVTSHTGRRSFATNAHKAGIDSLSIMQITSHTSESSFLRYIRVSKEENAVSLQKHAFFAAK
mgnify:CR=1 FL=1